ncbi:MAG TPA: PAC2 family protein [Candidatus Nanoarchaeia archaeon]|nr:PAC2 family protein [Candidatus Nanoarchaeia archaeon]
MTSSWQITSEVKTLPKLNSPILIEGLPGIGNVGKIAADFLVEEFKAVKLYSFFSYKFPHSVFVGENNLIDIPKIELYYKKFDGKKKDLLILVGDIQPIDEESCFTFCEEIIKIAKEFKCTEIVTTGGIGLAHPPENPKVYCTANDKQLFNEYLQKGMITEKKIFGIVGPIIGVSGVLLGLGKKRGMKGVALLAETFGHPMYLGIKGAKEILKVLDKKFNFRIDLEKMTKEITAVEKELMKRTKEWANEMGAASSAGAKLRQKEVGYIG